MLTTRGVSPGTRLGPYEVAALIGAGGMGQVYLASDTRLNRRVAIKILPPEFAADPSLAQRFQREARTISQFNHPNICTLYDVGEARLQIGETSDTIHYLVMEYVEGESLADRLARGALPLADVLRFGIQIADALGRAHRQGIVHRDLKPANVMLTASGAKLLDFGLAKYHASIENPPTSAVATAQQPAALTEEGKVVGTFQYMPPEQIDGKEGDPRSDIWALGCVLYEMATGERAFRGSTRSSLIASIVSSEPRHLSSLKTLSTPLLEHVVRKCLAKDPEERWQSAHDVASELRWIEEGGVGTEVSGTAGVRKGVRLGWVVASALTVAVLVLAALLLQRDRAAVPILRVDADAPRLNVRAGPGNPRLSPDGKTLLYNTAEPGKSIGLALRGLDSGSTRSLDEARGGLDAFWSPDGREIAFWKIKELGNHRWWTLHRMRIDGGEPVKICDAELPPPGANGSWNSEGVILFGGITGIFRVAAAGGKPQAVTTAEAASEAAHLHPHFLPDGKHFLYLAVSKESRDSGTVCVGSLDGGAPKRLVRAQSQPIYAGGYLLYQLSGEVMAQPFDVKRLELSGEPRVVATNVMLWKHIPRGGFSATPDLIAYVPHVAAGQTPGGVMLAWGLLSPGAHQLIFFDRSGTESGRFGAVEAQGEMALSPDGSTLAMTAGDPSVIWLLDLERQTRLRLTFGAVDERWPRWSPDGRSIAFSRVERGVHLYLRPAGVGTEKALAADPGHYLYPQDFSPDGQFLLYLTRGENADIWMYPLQGGKPSPYIVGPFDQWDARFSPDGQWVAYFSDESGRHEVYATSFPQPDQKVQISLEGGRRPRWRRDGKEILYLNPRGELVAVPVLGTAPLKLGRPVTLFRAVGETEPLGSYEILDDQATRFAVSRDVSESTAESEKRVSLIVNWRQALAGASR